MADTKMALFAAICEEWDHLEFTILDTKDDYVFFTGTNLYKKNLGKEYGFTLYGQIFEAEMRVSFVFGKLEASLDAFKWINKFNNNVWDAFALINENGNFEIRTDSEHDSVEDGLGDFRQALNYVVGDAMTKYLLPILIKVQY